MNFTPRNRMPIWLVAILLCSGIIFGVLGLIPFVGIVVDFIAWAFFAYIFYLRGASFAQKPKKLLFMVASLIVGLIPEAGDFLSDIVGLAIQIYFVRKEDKMYNKNQGNVGPTEQKDALWTYNRASPGHDMSLTGTQRGYESKKGV